MSDLQELIHKSSMSAHYQGAVRERERIIKLLEDNTKIMTNPVNGKVLRSFRLSPNELIILIKGEEN